MKVLRVPLLLLSLLLSAAIGAAGAEILPGFRVEAIAPASGFVSSVAADSLGILYYTTTAGTLFRLDGSSSIPVASVVTTGTGNAGLLGMALADDRTAAVHYTTPDITYEVISMIDLVTGVESELHRFACDATLPGRSVTSEHHGGNPTVARDGTIYVGIGDYAGGMIAQKPEWNAGKIWRIGRDGSATQMARGVRNSFDLAFDDSRQRIILADNGPTEGDEIHVFSTAGSDLGWPNTYGDHPPADGAVPPVYVFPSTVAPTGFLLLSGRHPMVRSGILVGGFVSKALHYFPDVDAQPVPTPISLIAGLTSPIIDVAQDGRGNIVFASTDTIYRLIPPRRGDCNGDGLMSTADLDTLQSELAEGEGEPHTSAQNGAVKASWGCDANEDGLITRADEAELRWILWPRRRAARSGP